MDKVISRMIMWLVWLFSVLNAVLMAHYLTKGITRLNSFSKPFDVFPIGMLVIPILICGGLRFWLSRIRNPWLTLLPFLIGIFFALQAEFYGIFLFPEFFIVFQILSGILLLGYLPAFVKFQPATTNV